MINVSCSRTQRSDACEARTRGPSVSCSLNKPGYEENYPCADPEGTGAPGPAKSQSYDLFSNTCLDPLENLKGKPEFRYLDSHHKKVVKDKSDSL